MALVNSPVEMVSLLKVARVTLALLFFNVVTISKCNSHKFKFASMKLALVFHSIDHYCFSPCQHWVLWSVDNIQGLPMLRYAHSQCLMNILWKTVRFGCLAFLTFFFHFFFFLHFYNIILLKWKLFKTCDSLKPNMIGKNICFCRVFYFKFWQISQINFLFRMSWGKSNFHVVLFFSIWRKLVDFLLFIVIFIHFHHFHSVWLSLFSCYPSG